MGTCNNSPTGWCDNLECVHGCRRDAELGIAWFNGLTERERAEWLRRADTAMPAEAWEFFKKSADEPGEKHGQD